MSVSRLRPRTVSIIRIERVERPVSETAVDRIAGEGDPALVTASLKGRIQRASDVG